MKLSSVCRALHQVHLTFQLGEDSTRVLSKLHLTPNYTGTDPPELSLNGERALLQSLSLFWGCMMRTCCFVVL